VKVPRYAADDKVGPTSAILVLSVIGNDKVEMWGDLELYDIRAELYEMQEMLKNISKCVCVCVRRKCFCMRQYDSTKLFYDN
jgi:hypothetical protein